MANDPHLDHDAEAGDGYYADGDSGEFLGESTEDFDVHDAESYYISVVNVEYECPRCGYTGKRYHPRRNRPTYSAELRKLCPNTDCRADMA